MKPTTQKLHFINNFLPPLENRRAKPGPNQVSEDTMKNGDASKLHSLSDCGSFRTYAGMGSWCSKHPVASTKWRPQCTVRQSTAIWVNAFFSECAGPVIAKTGSSLTVQSLKGMWGKLSSPLMLLCFNLQNHFVSNIFRFNSGLSSPQMADFKIELQLSLSEMKIWQKSETRWANSSSMRKTSLVVFSHAWPCLAYFQNVVPPCSTLRGFDGICMDLHIKTQCQ